MNGFSSIWLTSLKQEKSVRNHNSSEHCSGSVAVYDIKYMYSTGIILSHSSEWEDIVC